MIQHLASQWRMPLEIAVDLAKLALFDCVIYLDDSGSMGASRARSPLIVLRLGLTLRDPFSPAFEEGGSRIDDAKLIVSRVAQACSAFDDDGIQVRFMNSRTEVRVSTPSFNLGKLTLRAYVQGNGIKTEQEAVSLVSQIRFSGLTPLGTVSPPALLLGGSRS